MVALNFNPRFVPSIIARTKISTVRPLSKQSCSLNRGTWLQLYTGQRNEACVLIARSEVLANKSVSITADGNFYESGVSLSAFDRENLARADGFERWEQMLDFFKTTYKQDFRDKGWWHGRLIRWCAGSSWLNELSLAEWEKHRAEHGLT